MLYHAKSGSVKVKDTYMDYVSFGKGCKALVLIPGLNVKGVKGAAIALAYMYRIFAKEYKVYVFDRINVLPNDYTVRDIADDTVFAMQQLGIERADVFGVSQGGMVAQMLAIHYPQMVNKLVLGVTLAKQNETVNRVVNQWITYAERGDYQSINRETFTLMYSDGYLKKNRFLLPIAVKLVKPKDIHRFSILAKACTTFDAYDELNKINCPVLVLGGKQDKVVTARASEEIAEKLGCSIYMYEELGHAAFEEAADFNLRVLDFLEQ